MSSGRLRVAVLRHARRLRGVAVWGAQDARAGCPVRADVATGGFASYRSGGRRGHHSLSSRSGTWGGFRQRWVHIVALVVISSLVGLLAPNGGARSRTPDGRQLRVRSVATGATNAPAPHRPVVVLGGHAANVAREATVSLGVGSWPVPTSFLGVSVEDTELMNDFHHLALFTRVMSDLQAPGSGPLILRIGGASADESFWDPQAGRPSWWPFAVTPQWLTATSQLVRLLGLKAIVDLNVAADDPGMAHSEANAIRAAFPARSVVAFEIGNEPDLYTANSWYQSLEILRDHDRVIRYSPARYATVFGAYARALAPEHEALAGPALAYPHPEWIRRLIASDPGVPIITAHSYPYSACSTPSSPTYPTVGRLLSESATAGAAAALAPEIDAAHRGGKPLRLTEMNSVTCGGVPGVSNTFATALWAPDALFEMMRAGVDGVNMHVRARAINAAWVFGRTGLQARPLLYGLAMFARMLGPNARRLAVRVHMRGTADLRIWAVVSGRDHLKLLLVNKSGEPLTVRLAIPCAGREAVQRLLASSPSASAGVTLDGQSIGPDGGWHGVRARETVAGTAAGSVIAVSAYSAALVSFTEELPTA